MSPAIRRIRVDLPQPLGPIRTVVRPASTVRSVGRSTCTPPYDFVTPRSWSMPSWYDLHALPESDETGDVPGRRPGAGVVPGGVLVDLAVHLDGVVAGRALPGALRVVAAVAE